MKDWHFLFGEVLKVSPGMSVFFGCHEGFSLGSFFFEMG